MTCHILKTIHTPAGQTFADIFTYRYDGKLVYVPATLDYPQALSHARGQFSQLKYLPDASILFSLTTPNQAQKCVISAPAWPKLVADLPRFQIIDVHATSEPERRCECGVAPTVVRIPIPDITITYADADDAGVYVDKTEPVPPYSAARSGPDASVEKAMHLTRSSPSLRPRSSQSALHPGKRNWLLQKLHGNVFNAT